MRDEGMEHTKYKILVWLPSPMGDAILCTPALRAIRDYFKTDKIYFVGSKTVREILSPCEFNNGWIEQKTKNPFAIAKKLKGKGFTHAILFKNSFASALAVFWAGTPTRIGYAREGRGVFLTEKLYPPKVSALKFKPFSMIDYYLEVACRLGCDIQNRQIELQTTAEDTERLRLKIPELSKADGPIVVIVPGGAFGPSKIWPAKRFAAVIDQLIEKRKATVVVSVSPQEKKIAEKICALSKYEPINGGQRNLGLGQLKALISMAGIVISNDTGPRHIAIAFKRKLVTLFGPNNPQWTQTDFGNEIKIIGQADCAPCNKPICKVQGHPCMDSITVETVYNRAEKLLNSIPISTAVNKKQEFVESSKSFFIDSDYKAAFKELGINNIETVFSFGSGKNLAKANLAKFRSRIEFEISNPKTKLFLKRYDHANPATQIKNWFDCKAKRSLGFTEFHAIEDLRKSGIDTAKAITYGESFSWVFENRSFMITEKIPDAESLERSVPEYFKDRSGEKILEKQRVFIKKLADFVRKFHKTGYRHRDLYFCHIFHDGNYKFYLIDLARAFKPAIFGERFRIKDIAQLCYSAPNKYFSKTDRLRFYHQYTKQKKLKEKDKKFIRKVLAKTERMARHDLKHHRDAGFTG